MNKIKFLTATLLVGSCLYAANATENIGTISVNSTTIDDKFESRKGDVLSTVVVSGVEIEDAHAENIANVLNKISGVTARVNEGDSGKIHIRGVATEMYMGERSGVAIVIDGVPVQERAGSVNVDIDNIESIKIIKGGASYLYGNDAIAGAVVITTKRPKGENSWLATAEKGSFNYQKYLARVNGSTDNFAIELQASKKSSDGYWEDSDYWAKSFNGKLQYYIDESSDLTLGIDRSKRYENDSGSITARDNAGVNQIDVNPQSSGEVGYNVGYNIKLDKYFLTYSKDFENSSNLMAQIYKYEDTTTSKSGAYDVDGDGTRDNHKSVVYANTLQKGVKSEYRVEGDVVAAMVGVDLAKNESKEDSKDRINDAIRGELYTIGKIRSQTSSREKISALYGELKYAFAPKLVASIGARYDNMDYDFTDELTVTKYSKGYDETSYMVGATYQINRDSVIYTNSSTGFRVPAISQLYAGDFSTSTRSGTYVNNLNIETEKTYSYEVGLRGKIDSLFYDIAIYQIDRKDVIGRSSGHYAQAKGLNIEYENMADIRNMGLELSLSSDPNEPLFLALSYTFLDSSYRRYDEYNLVLYEAGVDHTGDGDGRDDYIDSVHNLSGNTVPRTSKHTISLEGNYRLMKEVLLTTEINYRSSQYADDLNRVKVAGYSIVNLRAKYKRKIASFDTEFFAKIDNLTDKQYYMMPRVTGDRNDDGVYNDGDMGLTVNPGRVFLAGLSMKF